MYNASRNANASRKGYSKGSAFKNGDIKYCSGF